MPDAECSDGDMATERLVFRTPRFALCILSSYACRMPDHLPGLLVLDAGNPGPMTGAGNHTYLLLGRTPTLIDAGVGRPAHLAALAAALEGAQGPLAQVLVTHAHADHVFGAPALRQRWPGARFLKHPWPAMDARHDVSWQPIAHGDVLEAGDTTLHAVHTPGHAPDHLCFWHAESRTLFGGDLLVAGGTVVIPASRGGDLAAYLRSLAAVAALAPLRVLPAHGPVIDEPTSLIERYSAHRADREREVLAAISAGTASVDAIAACIYPDLADTARGVAVDTVRAHVKKLRDEGRVIDRDGMLQILS